MNINCSNSLFSIIILLDILGLNIVFMIINILAISCLLMISNYNNIEVIELLSAPLHICPEWYFLCFYAILKTIPSK